MKKLRNLCNMICGSKKIQIRDSGDVVYEPIGEIADGATAIVYAAKNMRTGEDVIMKRFEYDATHMYYFNPLREILLLKYLTISEPLNDYIGKYVDSYKTKKGCDIILEYNSEYMELFNFINSRRQFTLEVLSRITMNLVDGLYHMHMKNVAHRDIKFENILVDTKEFKIKYIDFGGAIASNFDSIDKRIKHEYTKFKRLFYRIEGTRDFFPPEILRASFEGTNDDISNIRYFDETYKFSDATKHDIWCLGIVIYQLINFDQEEIFPYKYSDDDIVLYNNICNEKWNKVINIDKFGNDKYVPPFDFEYLIFWMLNINKDLRPSASDVYNYIHREI